MYYIYHIQGVKIGCTNNLKRRIKEQGFDNYELLEEHLDKSIASTREKELQKKYGYRIDTLTYNESVRRITKAQKISLKTKDEWLPNVDWKAREAKIDKNLKWEKIKSSQNYINMDRSAIGYKAQAKRRKIILQYDLNGNLIKEWTCGVRNMPEKYKCAGIAANPNSNSKTMYGFIWKYKEI
jgi:hypothetical protein